MTTPSELKLAYEYVVLRCVPRVDREEFLNVGVVLHCQMADFLDVVWRVDRDRDQGTDPARPSRRLHPFRNSVARGERGRPLRGT